MIKKLLKKFGYIHKSEAEEEFLKQYIESLGDTREYSITHKEEEDFFNLLSRVDGIADFLKATSAKDIQRHFTADPRQRDVIHGAFARTVYLYSRLKKSNKQSAESRENKVTKIDGLRYS